MSTPAPSLPTDSQARKDMPLTEGCFDYFPAALAEVARLSKAGNDKHNPGQPLHHARGKSMDHANCIARHLIDRGTLDEPEYPGGPQFLHDVKMAWRALANLQELLEKRGAPLARGARLPAQPATLTAGSRGSLGEGAHRAEVEARANGERPAFFPHP